VSDGNRTLENGFITDVEYVRTVDGDTIEFCIKRTFKVRLRNIDVEEVNTDKGKLAKEFIEGIMEHAGRIQIFIPSNDSQRLMDFHSFERIVADVYINGKNIKDTLRKGGFEKVK
jgi:endonuclease YncB( thermonuclease family)